LRSLAAILVALHCINDEAIGATGAPNGVINWTEAHVGDPATDFVARAAFGG
jgi:hypothetical protein